MVIQVFCHVSTAFCHCDVEVLEERLYDPPTNPHDVLAAVSWMSDEMVENLKPLLLGVHPNSYTYSKRLAEGLMAEYGSKLPIVICRPAIVIPSYLEPVPGWVDSLNGPIGMIIAGAKGVLRSMLGNPDTPAQVIPVDLCINMMIYSACARAIEKTPEIPVYNITCIEKIEVNWGTLVRIGTEMVDEYPLDPGLWCPRGYFGTNSYYHALIVLLFQIIPAYLIDFILLLLQQKRFMVKIQKRLLDGLKVFQYFTMRKWNFCASKILEVPSILDKEEREIFPTSNVQVDIHAYIKDVIIGSRIYCLREPIENQPRAKFIHRIIYYVDVLIRVWLLYYMFSCLWPYVSRNKLGKLLYSSITK